MAGQGAQARTGGIHQNPVEAAFPPGVIADRRLRCDLGLRRDLRLRRDHGLQARARRRLGLGWLWRICQVGGIADAGLDAAQAQALQVAANSLQAGGAAIEGHDVPPIAH